MVALDTVHKGRHWLVCAARLQLVVCAPVLFAITASELVCGALLISRAFIADCSTHSVCRVLHLTQGSLSAQQRRVNGSKVPVSACSSAAND